MTVGKNAGPHQAMALQQAAANGGKVFVCEVKIVIYWTLPEEGNVSAIPKRVIEYLAETGLTSPEPVVLSVTPMPQHFN